MFELYIILQIGILLFGTCVWLSYRSDRSNNKQRLKRFIQSRESSRELTQEELKLLEPYLTKKKAVRPYKLKPLIDYKVSQIEGSCTHHGLLYNGKVNDYYYEIDNIEVFFPYQMSMFIKKFNKVDVVLTKNYAIVVNINTCDLEFAFNNYDPNFTSGIKTIEMPESFYADDELIDDKDDHAINYNIEEDEEEKIEYETLSTRDETPLEALTRNQHNNGILTAISLVVATLLFIVLWANQMELSYGLSAIITISLILAVVCLFVKPKRLTNLKQVNIIKANIFDKDTINNTVVVSETTNLSYPKYWSKFLPSSTPTPIEMEMVEESKKLLRYGHTLSINREVEEFGPPKIVERNILLVIIAGILSLALICFSEPINNTISAYRYYNNQLKNWQINDLTSLNQSDIKRGDLINMTIKGTSCDVENINQENKCNHFFINTKPFDAKDNKIMLNAQIIKRVFNKDSVKTVRDDEMLLFEKYQKELVDELNKQSNMFSFDRYEINPFVKLKDIGPMIIDINDVCNIFDYECKFIKMSLLNLHDTRDYEEEYWDDIVKEAKSDPTYSLILEEKRFDSFINDLHRLKEELMFKIKRTVLRYQLDQSDVEITLANVSYIEIPQSYNIDHLQTDNDLNESRNYYYNLLTNNDKGNINLIGMIDDISYRQDNTISALKINSKEYYRAEPQKIYSLTSPVIVNIFMFAILIFVLVLNGILLIKKVIFNRKRLNQITQYYKDRIF